MKDRLRLSFEREKLQVVFSLHVDHERQIIHLLDLHQEGTLWLVNTLDRDMQEMIVRKLHDTYGIDCCSEYRWFIYEPIKCFQFNAHETEYSRRYAAIEQSDEVYDEFLEQVHAFSN